MKDNPEQELRAKRIASDLIKYQTRISNYLNKTTAHFSRTQKQILLIGISLFFSACSLYLIFKSIQ